MSRSLIVNADDFGLSPGVNRGILEAHAHGIVTSASLMVRWPAAREAVENAKAFPDLGLGLHIDLAEWAYRNDDWIALYEVIDMNDERSVLEEVSRQIVAFQELVGRDPTHLDSHQHVHLHEPVQSVLRDAGAKLGVPVRHFSSVAYCGGFYGQDGRGNVYPEGITAAHLVALIEKLGEGITELACHPGHDDGLDSMYRGERSLEIATLCDANVRAAIEREGIRLRNFTSLS